MVRIGVVDVGQGNIEAVCNIIDECGFDVSRLKIPSSDLEIDWLILPGVGNFGAYASLLMESNWHSYLKSQKEIKVLAICVGFQYLANFSEEHPGAEGLGIVDATVDYLGHLSSSEKVPHVGWREVPELGGRFYFTHSYYMPSKCEVDSCISLGFGGGEIAVYLQKDNFYGVQFHPEKSGKNGMSFFLRLFSESF